MWRHEHRLPLKRWLFFSLSLSDNLIHAESQSISKAPPTHPYLISECRWCWHVTSGSSSLHVLHRHFSLHFLFPRSPDREAPVMMWKGRLRSLHNSSGLMNASWTHSSPRCYRISFLNRWRIKGDQNGSNLLLIPVSTSLTPRLFWGALCVRSEKWHLFTVDKGETLCGMCDSVIAFTVSKVWNLNIWRSLG